MKPGKLFFALSAAIMLLFSGLTDTPAQMQQARAPQQRAPQTVQRRNNRNYNEYQAKASQGENAAHIKLGMLYANGQGVKHDPVQALKWYMRAADMGNTKAEAMSRKLETTMTPQQIAQARTLATIDSGRRRTMRQSTRPPTGNPVIINRYVNQIGIIAPAEPANTTPVVNETVIVYPEGNQTQSSSENAAAQPAKSELPPEEEKDTEYVFVGTMTSSGETTLYTNKSPHAAVEAVVVASSSASADSWEFAMPQGEQNPDAIGVILAPSAYLNKDIPPVKYALNDARLVKNYFIKTFGIPDGNIIYAENPTLAQFNRIFGTQDNPKGQLFNYIKPKKSDVYIYYAGHGAPDIGSHASYLIPVDGTPDYLKTDGYSLDVFYKNLAKLPARSVNVFIDACFSGGSAGGMLIKSASPLAIQAKQDVPTNINVPPGASSFCASSTHSGSPEHSNTRSTPHGCSRKMAAALTATIARSPNVMCRQVSKQVAAVAMAASSCASVSFSNVLKVLPSAGFTLW